MPLQSNRRSFIKKGTLAGAGLWLAASPSYAPARSANDKMNVACIGVGGMGKGDCEDTAELGCNIVAVCDVDDERAKGMYEKFPKATRFRDFRKMLDKMHKEIDAVTISTPDHTHAVATMAAMKLGKHVYTQKPLTHDVYEARVLTDAAKRYPVVTQMGNQGTASAGLREAVEVIQSGAIGPVREVHVWTNRPVWPQGAGAILKHKAVGAAITGRGKPAKMRSTLDWDLWLGTAPVRPYDPIYLPFNWRGWWDYGTGALGDMACHTANMPFMACKLGYPTSIEAESSEYNDQTFPMWAVINYDFPERDGMPPLKLTWYEGGADKPSWVNRKLRELAYGREIPGSGSLVIGDKGTLFSPNDNGGDYVLLPEKDFEGYKPPSPSLPRAPRNNHRCEWITACRENKPEMCMSNFGYAGPLTEALLLGNVAMRTRKRIEWDGENMRITNAPEANRFLRREYRKGWEL